jgi:hypothetical protein
MQEKKGPQISQINADFWTRNPLIICGNQRNLWTGGIYVLGGDNVGKEGSADYAD